MHLTVQQADRYFDIFDALLAYVNARFGVVEDFTLDLDDPLLDAKASFIAQELWNNPDIIDDFCAENPFHLAARDVAVAASWKYALRDSFVLVRYQAGCAMLMNDERVFAVCGVTADMEEMIGTAPAILETTLLPFEGCIICDGFMNINDVALRRVSTIEDDFERLVSLGVVSTEDDLSAFVTERNQAQQEAGFDAFLEDLLSQDGAGAEEVPEGFHRSVIAGLSGQARKQAIIAHLRESSFATEAGPMGFWLYDAVPIPGSEREQVERAVLCASACVTYCGIATLSDVYGQYREVYEGSFAQEQFEEALRTEAATNDVTYEFWRNNGVDYVVHYTLSARYIASQMHQEAFAPPAHMPATLEEELENLDEILLFLVEEHQHYPMRRVPRVSVEIDEIEQLMNSQSVSALRAFLDERVPDGEDDYFFVDGVLAEMVNCIIESGQIQAPLAYVTELGLDGSCADPKRLPKLIRNVYNTMPSWENNGWSPRELKERLTGRTQFYDERGDEMHIGPNDPCPCGSGKLYRNCHGR